MPVTYQSSIGSNLSISFGNPDAGTPLDWVAQTYDTQAGMGDIAAQSGGSTAVVAVVDATAFGTNTLAQVSGSLSIANETGATTTQVDIDAFAAAQSQGDFVLTSTSIDVAYYGGGGTYLSISQASTHDELDAGTSTSTSYNGISLVVINLTGEYGGSVTTPNPVVAPPDYLQPDGQPDAPSCGCDPDGETSLTLDGNLASFDIAANAFGDNTGADLVVDAFALEDSMSAVIVMVDLQIY